MDINIAQCKIEHHKSAEFVSFCVSEKCEYNRRVCDWCIKDGIHHGHNVVSLRPVKEDSVLHALHRH